MTILAILRTADEWSFAISLILVILFYLQYRIYERSYRHQKMADRFLGDN